MGQNTILVVDDERNIIELARLYLEKEGFAVESAETGVQALQKNSHSQPGTDDFRFDDAGT